MNFQTIIHINRINLPTEILETIKAFLFYDIQTFKAIKTYKYLNRFIVRDIENAISRNACKNKLLMTEMSSKWIFLSADIHKTIILHARNCLSCGNYIETNNLIIPDNALCICNDFIIVRS